MREIKTYKGQSLTDIAIQEYGDVSGVEYLIEDNGIGLSDWLAPGTLIKIRETAINQLVIDSLKQKKIKVNNDNEQLHGLELWAIDINFQIL